MEYFSKITEISSFPLEKNGKLSLEDVQGANCGLFLTFSDCWMFGVTGSKIIHINNSVLSPPNKVFSFRDNLLCLMVWCRLLRFNASIKTKFKVKKNIVNSNSVLPGSPCKNEPAKV